MHISTLNGKHVCILGFGKEGQAMLAAIGTYAPEASVTVADQNESLTLKGKTVELQLGPTWLTDLDRFDVLIKSPGIPPSAISSVFQLPSSSSRLTNSVQIFLDTVRAEGSLVIGVTGSKGKSTTTSLIGHILKSAGRDAHIVGNIGEPSIAHIKDAKINTTFIHELSSYQLMNLTSSPSISVVTSFFPEHLDYHGSLEAYRDAKANIARFQDASDVTYFTSGDTGAEWIASQGKGRKIAVTPDAAHIALKETKLIGDHNIRNIAFASSVCRDLGVSDEVIAAALRTFEPLPHRLQSLGIIGGVEWIDDAISTTPESTIAALDALGERVKTIILGGQDRGYEFTNLAKRIKESNVQTIILFPGSGPRIREALIQAQVSAIMFEVSSMEEAVNLAKKHTKAESTAATPIVLLSTASPSYGMFKNFEEKGEAFNKCIKA